MKKFPAWILFLCGINLCLAGTAKAAVMAIWDFGLVGASYTENVTTEYVNGIPTLSVIGGDKDTNGKDGTAFTDADGGDHGSGQAVAWEDVSILGPDDASFTIAIDTTGWQNIQIRWDYLSDATGGNQGPVSVDFHYSALEPTDWLGSAEWNDMSLTRDDQWHEFSLDLSGITAINNNPVVQFLFDDLDENDLDGEFLFDNLQITGTVPEPSTVSLLALGFLIGRRRKTK